MANPVFLPKRSSTPSSIPTTGDLIDGELAVNSSDKKIYLRDGSNIIEVANNPGWVSSISGIYTLDNVGVGNNNPGEKLDVTGSIRASSQLISTVATGTAPLSVTSTTLVTNLNADLLDGQQGSYYLNTSTTFGGDVSGTYNNIQVANDSHTHAFNNLTFKTSGTGNYTTTGTFTGNTLASTVATGTAPFTVTSTTVVSNLNADLLDGIEASQFLRSDADDTATGLITLTNGLNVTSGNVGIGTINPTATLDVNGDVNITGIVTATKFVGDGSSLTNLPGGGGGSTETISPFLLIGA